MSITGFCISAYISNNELSVSLGVTKGKGQKRGKVTGISRKSRSRLVRFINQCSFSGFAFVTLTYRYNMQDDAEAYKQLRNFYKAFERKGEKCCIVWRKELQERGAIHYHLFVLDPSPGWNEETVKNEWMGATHQQGDIAAREYGTEVKTFDLLTDKDAGVIVTYLAKYAAKDGFSTKGKAWGILGRKYAVETGTRVVPDANKVMGAADWLVGQGARSYEITPTGVQYRLYLGNVGGSGGAQADSRVIEFVGRIL